LCTNGFANLIDPILARITKSAGYNQDAVNTILRLINKGHEDVALKILKGMPRGTKTDGQLNDTGNFYIRHLVKAQRPAETILAICKELEAGELNSRALLIAVEAALANGENIILLFCCIVFLNKFYSQQIGLVDTAKPLLKAAHANGLPIRQHYFWPLMCSASEKGQNQVIDILQAMQSEFNISASGETIRDYVIPNLKEKNYEKIVNLLRTGGTTISTAYSNVVHYAVTENDMKKAAEFAEQRRAFYSPNLFRRPLLQALNQTKDVDSYVRVVRQIYDNLPRIDAMEASRVEEADEQDDGAVEGVAEATGLSSLEKQKECLGTFILDACVYFRTNRVEMLENILQGFVDQGLSISNRQAEKVSERLSGAELTEKISLLLGKLAAGDLAPVTIERVFAGDGSGRGRGSETNFEMDIGQIERLIQNLEAKGENVKSLKRQLLIAAIKKKDLEKTKEIIERLEAENYVITSGAYAQLIDLYCAHGKLDEALAVVDRIRAKDPEFLLDDTKKIHIVQLMCEQDKYEEALKFINTATPKAVVEEENGGKHEFFF
jgi:leucine-rich PPR motif-containing protein, mitochondrial